MLSSQTILHLHPSALCYSSGQKSLYGPQPRTCLGCLSLHSYVRISPVKTCSLRQLWECFPAVLTLLPPWESRSLSCPAEPPTMWSFGEQARMTRQKQSRNLFSEADAKAVIAVRRLFTAPADQHTPASLRSRALKCVMCQSLGNPLPKQ